MLEKLQNGTNSKNCRYAFILNKIFMLIINRLQCFFHCMYEINYCTVFLFFLAAANSALSLAITSLTLLILSARYAFAPAKA